MSPIKTKIHELDSIIEEKEIILENQTEKFELMQKDSKIKGSKNVKRKSSVIKKFKFNEELLKSTNMELNEDLLQPNKFVLTPSENQKKLFEEFHQDLKKKMIFKDNIFFLILIIVSLIKAIIFIGIRAIVYNSSLIISLKICFVIIVIIFSLLRTSIKKMSTYIYCICFLNLFGVFTCLIGIYYTKNELKAISSLDLIELSFILYLGLRLR